MLSGRLRPTPSTLPPQSLWRVGNTGCLLDILSVYSTLTSRPQTFFLFLITLSAQRPDATRASHLLACQQSHYRLVEQEEEGGEGHWGSSPFRNKAIVLHYSWRGCWGVQRENKSISTPVFHHRGSYQFDTEPTAWRTRIQLRLNRFSPEAKATVGTATSQP